MLALNRGLNQKIDLFIDGKKLGTIEVVEIHRSAVKLGFDMPREVVIVRREVAPDAYTPTSLTAEK